MGLKKNKGFGLTEGLIGLAVLSSGLLAIYGAHTGYIKSFADDREKANMMSRLSSEMIKAKSFATCDALATYAESVSDLSMSALKHNGDNTACDVTISGDWNTPLSQGSALLKGLVFLRDLKLVSDDEFNEGDGRTGIGVATSPTGDASYGDNKVLTTEVKIYLEDNKKFNLKVVEGKDGKFYLLDTSENANGLNVLEGPSLFYKISGKIYLWDPVNKNDGYDLADLSNVYAGAPDTSVCRTRHLPSEDPIYYSFNGASSAVAVSSSESSTVDRFLYTEYVCYVGAGWYGSIGVTEIDQSGKGNNQFLILDEDSCLGSPDQNDVQSAYSKHSQDGLTRKYTKYKAITGTHTAESGETLIKYSDEGFPVCEAKNSTEYSACSYEDQDFVVTGGGASCSTMLTSLQDDYAGFSVLVNNPGSNVCLDGSDFCPYSLSEPYSYSDEEVSFTIGLWNSASGSLTTDRAAAETAPVASVTFTEAVNGTVISGAPHTCTGSNAFYSCSFVPALGEGFSSTWSSYAIGDLKVVIDSTECTGNPADSDQLVSVSGGVTTILRENFRLSESGQEVHLTGCQ